MKSKMSSIIIVLFCCPILISCDRENTSPSLPSEGELYNIRWLLKAFEVVGDTVEFLPVHHQYFLVFGEYMHGETDSLCINSYGGEYTIQPPNKISIGPILSTRAYCRESYWRYLDWLKQSAWYEIQVATLYLWSLDRTQRLVFESVHQ